MTEPKLIPELAGYRARFHEADCEVRRTVEMCTQESFNMQPDAGAWSAGQCLHHLIISGQQTHRKIAAAVEAAETSGPFHDGPFRYGFISRLFVRSMQPDFALHIPAPKTYHPAGDPLDPEAVMADFSALQAALVAVTERANGLDLKRIRVPSPLTDWLKLSLGAWLAAVAGHQERHLKQAREALRAVEDTA